MAATARRIALSVLNTLNGSDASPDNLIYHAFEEDSRLIRRDRALANELVLGVLRWRGRLDWIIQQLSDTPIHKIDPFVLNVIRLGLYQILFLSRIPARAAVHESVELAKARKPAWVVRFVNAVLRAAARRAQDIPLPDDSDDPAAAIAIRESHPSWIVKRWVRRFGVEETRRLCVANNQIPPVTVRANTLKVSRKKLLQSLEPYVGEIKLAEFAPDGLRIRGIKKAIREIPAFQNGWFQVQDEAAQIVTQLLGPRPGETVLDACAGLGGKTGHIAQVMHDRGVIHATDNQPWKLEELQLSMLRLGISSTRVWEHDLMNPFPDSLVAAFDRVLLDAPCSGLGVLRRNPDIKWKKGERDIKRLQNLQQHFLAAVAPLVKEGGTLVYCVCSFEPEEGEMAVEGFLKNHPAFVIDRTPAGLSKVDEALMDSSGFFKTLPHKHDMDGFFAVRLKRVAV